MVSIHELILQYLPHKRKQNSRGWTNFDSPCCHHRGHNRDTRSRGNLFIDQDGSIVTNCYNCGFKAAFKNNILTSNFEIWMGYLGIPKDAIQKLKISLLSEKLNGIDSVIIPKIKIEHPTSFREIEFPDNTVPLSNKIQKAEYCYRYLQHRGRAVSEGYSYYWCNSASYNLEQRIIIPFYYRNSLVGWTSRYAGNPPKGVSRYYNGCKPQNYLFNSDVMYLPSRKFIVLVEGPFDAIAVSGVATLGKSLNSSQIAWVNSLNKEVILLPDREAENQDLIDIAIEQGWNVSFPNWDNSIKDAAEASKKYGKLWTINSAIQFKTNNKLEISIKRQLLKG